MNREFKRRGIQEILIHTGQHYDYQMSQVFFDTFDLPKPDYYLGVKNHCSLDFTAEAISELGKVFQDIRPDFVLGYGDVNSTMSAAIAAVKLAIPFAHVEGGIRSTNLYNPEEINRRISDVLADVVYCCTRTDVSNLKKEGYKKRRIVLSGDLMKDALIYTLNKHDIRPSRGDYMLLTLHREENIGNPERVQAIFEGLIQSGKKIIFPAHPRTFKTLGDFGLMQIIARSKIEVIKPLDYVQFVRLAAGADKILTDSGGVRREAYLMQKPCIVLIELSWFPEISKAGWKVLTGPDPNRITHLINDFEPTGEHQNIFGDGRAYLKIMDDLEKRFAK